MSNLKPVTTKTMLERFFAGDTDPKIVKRAGNVLASHFLKVYPWNLTDEQREEALSLGRSQTDKLQLITEIGEPYSDDHINDYFTMEDAIKVVKNNYHKGLSYYVAAGAFLYVELPDGDKDGRGYKGYTTIVVSQKQALKYIVDNMKSFADKGVRMHIRKGATSFHIG